MSAAPMRIQFGRLLLRSNFTSLLLPRSPTPPCLRSMLSNPLRSIMTVSIPTCPLDHSSYANAHEIKITHSHINLRVDFDRKQLIGHVTHTAVADVDGVSTLVLDTNHLDIKSASIEGGAELTQELGPFHEAFGTPIRLQLGSSLRKGDEVKVRINYSTTEKGGATQWLEPSQTVGKRHPYLFTQCQAIHARSLVPIQDSPSVKLKYSAEIAVPKNLRALMSAVPIKEEVIGEHKICSFDQKIGIPSYLIALAVGNLEGRKVGPRSTVWSEPEVVDAAAWEFADTETFVATGEKLLTPYVWGVYDLLLLPASFPYGGMENPCTTFVTPSLIAGDRSLVDVVAHEITHSWMGNLVTSASWEHFWLNEGFTMCIERKIVAALYGEQERHFSAIIGVQALKETVEHYDEIKRPELTKLVPDLKGIDPDDAFSSIPYEKGFHLLFYLENILGGAAVFDPYLKDYVETFSHKSITSWDFKDHLYKYFEAKKDILDTVDWEAWFKGNGMPPVKNVFDTTLATACADLSEKWNQHRDDPAAGGFSKGDLEAFTTWQIVAFLEALVNLEPFPIATLELMDSLYGLTQRRNCEIRSRWLQVALKANWEKLHPAVVDMVTTMGRMKYVRPLYRGLAKTERGKALARETFAKHKAFYHPICAAMVQKDLV